MKKRLCSLILALVLAFSQAVPALALDEYGGIAPGAWYETAARYAVDRGFMAGTGRGFDPDATVTRAQVVQILYNMAGRPMDGLGPDNYSDAEGTWYEDAARWALYHGITEGAAFRGGETITRSETAVLIYHYAVERGLGQFSGDSILYQAPDFAKIPVGDVAGMSYCYENGVITGDQKGRLNPEGTLTRAQMAQVAYNLGQIKARDPGALRVAVRQDGYGTDMWYAVAEAFTAQTGIQVEVIASKNLEQEIGPAMQGGNYPDVVYLSTGREAQLTETLIRERGLADLTGVWSMTVPGEDKKVSEKILPGFTETSQTNPYGDGKSYLAPMFYSPCGLFYDQTLFARKGWSVPKTWDEMWALGDKAKAEGMYLFTYPTTGYLDMIWYGLLYEAGGPSFFKRATLYERGVWDTPEGRKCFDVMAKLASYTHPLTPGQANDQDFQSNQQLVLDGKALFMPNGSWIIGEMADRPRADGFQWGMTALPGFTGGDRYSYTWMEQCWVPAAAAHMDAAKQFVAFLYSDKACELFANSRNEYNFTSNAIQPVRGMSGKLAGENALFASVFEGGAKPAMGTFADYKSAGNVPTVRETWMDPMNSLAAGLITKQQWLDQIKRASDQMRENLY